MNYLAFTNALIGGFILGIFTVTQVKIPFLILYSSFCIALFGCIYLYWKNKKLLLYFVLLLCFIAGLIRCAQADSIAPNDISNFVGKTLQVQGEAIEIPQERTLAGNKRSMHYIVKVHTVEFAGEKVQVNGNLKVFALQDSSHTIAHISDCIRFSGEIRELHGYNNPGSLDIVAMMQRQGIRANCKAEKNTVEILSAGQNAFLKWIEKSRTAVQNMMEEAMPKEDAAALFAMLFGGYDGIKEELALAFTVTGIVHILSVSGSHISLLAGTVHIIGKMLRFPACLSAILVILAIVFYAIFSGFTSPVVRSAIMGILAFSALALNREKDARYSLALTGLGILAISPRLIFDISFQLSFMATAGLLYIAPKIKKFLKGVPLFIAENLAITIAAQLAVIPFIAWYFNNVSLSALLANLIIVPFIEWAMIGGLCAVLLSLVFSVVGKGLFILCSLTIGLVYFMARAMAMIPYGLLYLPSGGLLCGIVYYLLLFWLCGYASPKIPNFLLCWQKKKKLICSAIVTIIFLWSSQFIFAQPLRIHFIDVGQGDSILITTPHGRTMLFDTGGMRREISDFDIAKRIVIPYLRHYGIREIDYLCLTHAHEDHAGGAGSLLKEFSVQNVIVGREDRSEYAKTLGYSLEKCQDFVTVKDGQFFVLDGVKIEIFSAGEVSESRTGNEISNVFRVSYGDFSLLITGDIDSNGEKELMRKHRLKSSVLKVAHHGSRTSSCEEFLQAVNPQYAIISVGFQNSFGHPNPQVLNRLNKENIKILRTDQAGAILMETNGNQLSVDSFQKNGKISRENP